MISIMYVCVASRCFSVRRIHSTGAIFLSHGVEGGGETLSRHVVWTQCAVGLRGILLYKNLFLT